ncbi:small ribosomal subunit protein uS17 [endosymbiont GvMRE of Glomus versiforme]|jgi:small subunit ribosomal protein S17|uniref:small ribosomal subunit protein uS17 n=1 Tax=endosymbiont GvMRE of Glomus versiforme TaxID=2039283 RepID=UPI000EBCF1A5|nr:uS17 family ribosomal protein [endosymbiont GvMRE of Glomus versiforme]RHZ36839.1 30S ribosomal protein S17 [endosymbiont GvMRE of Glomus versiforme]
MNKVFSGTVIKSKQDKTVKVELIFHRRHPKYQKVLKIKDRKTVHNEDFSLKIGDKVVIKNSRPYSKTKRFLVIEKVEKA